MAATDMRLRLIIRRYGLPEVKLVWPCAASDDLTVASLLTQVNDVVTLESGQWGLEDYAVELADQYGGSFECLHFQQVGKLLKQDDQVIIRSLLTEDLRQRRISGRHQISGDGIHLVDGIPFGRRRGPRDRPTLPLPPRKRARITYDSDQEDDEQAEENSQGLRQLLLEDTPLPDQDDDSEDDGDFDPNDESDADNEEDGYYADALAAELRFIREDNGTFEADKVEEPHGKRRRRLDEPEKEKNEQESSSQLLKLEGMTPAAVIALKAAFPLTPHATIEAKLDGRNSNLEATYKDLASTNDPALNYDAMMSIFMENRFNHVMAPIPSLLPETPKAGKPLIEEIEEPQAVVPSTVVGQGDEALKSLDSSSESPASDDDSSEPGEGWEGFLATPGDPSSADSDSDESSSESGQSDGEASNNSSSGSPTGPHDMSSGATIEQQDEGSSSESSSNGDDSMQGMSNSDAIMQKKTRSNLLIDDVTPAAPSVKSSSDEDTSEDSESDDSSEHERCSREPRAVAQKGSSLLQKAFADSKFGRSSDSESESDSESDSQGSDSSSNNSDEGKDDSSSDQDDQMSVDDSSSDSSGESNARGEPTAKSSARHPQQAQKTSAFLGGNQATLVAEPVPQPTVGRAQGLSRTQKRNARRRQAKQKHRAQEGQSELGQSANQDVVTEEMSLSQRRRQLAKAIEDAEAPSSDESSSSASSSSSESSSDSEASPDEESTSKKDARPMIEVVDSGEAEHSQEPTAATPNLVQNLETTLLPVDSSGLPITTPNVSAAKDDSARKRMKVDMGAGRRLLFGALGLKNPKNKTDEEKLKKNLMKDVRPHQNHRQETIKPTAEGEAQPEAKSEENDNWRDKITYRAVECCYEGMVLSEPPFPFVQRWDPQQQYNSMRKRKRNSQHFEEYYEEDSWYDPQDHGSSKKKKRNKKRVPEKQQSLPDNAENHPELEYDDPPSKNAAGEAGDTQVTDLDDLPSLPADPSTLPPISSGEAKVGMVVSWQRLELSKATNWQPQMHRVTAIIVSMEADKVHLVLAKRDREKDERIFDEDGNRMYDKFEMPEDDDLGEDFKPDDGHREMSWDELTDARLVQGEPSPSMLNSPVEESFEGVNVQSFVENAETGSQAPASSFNDVDSVQLRVGVEEELRNMEHEAEEAPESSSIPSGQNHAYLDFTAHTMEQPSNGNNSEEPSQPSTSDKTAREESQSQNRLSDGVVRDSQNASAQRPSAEKEPQQHSLGDLGHQDVHDTSLVNITYASSQAGGQKDKAPSIDYPQLPVPSSTSSLRSGRQPESDFVERANNGDEGTPIPESGPSAIPDSAPFKIEEDSTLLQDTAHSRGSSSDSFPALDEIWHTAKTSKAQSPLKSSQGSALAHKNKKLKVEPLTPSQRPSIEEMPEATKSTRSLFPNATQPEPELLSVSTPRRSSRRSQAKSSPFVIPEGSQVITLSSSPASEKYIENYAEDDADDTYEDPESSSLPKGAGWVTKKQNQSRKGRSRKMSA